MKKLILIFLLLWINIHFSSAQIDVPGDLDNEYFRLLALKNEQVTHLGYWPTIDPFVDSLTWSLWDHRSKGDQFKEGLTILNPGAKTHINSSYARGFNDGPVWKGKGITQEVNLGLRWKKNRLSVMFVPNIFYSQNLPFELATQIKDDVSPFSYQFANKFAVSYRVDWVQRYGDNAFVNFHPGQSEIRYQYRLWTVGVGTQNFKWGPSILNPIILSRNAGGFPSLDIGTSRPIKMYFKDIDLGTIDTKILLGRLSESNYFDSFPENDKRFFTGMSIGYSLPFLSNLVLGFNKVLYKQEQYFTQVDLAAWFWIFDNGIMVDSVQTRDTFDQLSSVFLDWKFQEVDLRVYLELARNDFSGGWWSLTMEPEHSRAYTIGLEKVFDLARKKYFLFMLEHSNLVRSQSWRYRASPVYYQHIIIDQGYTHQGQLLGAGIGGGSMSQFIGMSVYDQKRLYGIDFQVIRFDDDYYSEMDLGWSQRPLYLRHQNEFNLGFKYQREYENWAIGAKMINSFFANRYYVWDDRKYNLSLNIQFKYFL